MEKYVKCPRCRHEFIKRGFKDDNLLRAGRQEVVEWIEEQGHETFRTGYYPSQEMWQAQKKVWFNEKV